MDIKEVSHKGLAYEYAITVPAADLEQQIERELKQVGQRTKVPGFRPGKVPMAVLKQKYGKNVMGDVIQNSVNDVTRKVLEEKDLRPAMQPDVEITNYEEGGDLEFKMEFEVMPAMPELDYSTLSVEKLTCEVPEEDVTKALEDLLAQQKHFHGKPADEKAEKGDAVKIDFLGKKDGVAFDGGAAQGFQLELGSGQFIPGFEDQLIGKKAGDEVEVNVTFPEQYHSEDLAGAPVVFEVKVHEVLEPHTPEADDDFAKKLGLESLDKLKEAIKDKLGADYEGASRAKAKKALFDLLDEKVNVDIPEKMAKMEFDGIWQQVQQMIDRKDPSIEGKSEKELKEEYETIANRRVRLGIFLSELGRVNNLQVSREELTSAVMSQARMYPGQEQKVLEFYQQNPNEVDQLRGPILEEKAVDFLLEKVERPEKKVSPEALFTEDDAEDAKPKKKAAAKKPAAKKADKADKDA